MIYCTVVIPPTFPRKKPAAKRAVLSCPFLGMLRRSAFCKADFQPVMTPVGLKRGKATI